MTNLHRALEAIAAAIDGFTAPEAIPGKALENLHHAGLITPDLPGPAQSFSDGTKFWFVEDDEVRDIASIYIFNGEVLLSTAAGRVKGAPAKMRKIGLALLAAANHAEEEA